MEFAFVFLLGMASGSFVMLVVALATDAYSHRRTSGRK